MPVIRGQEIFYCFLQVKQLLFPNVPKSTLRSWMKELGISCVPCGMDEREFLKLMLPKICGAFGLINACQLQHIVKFKETKSIKSRQRYATSNAGGICLEQHVLLIRRVVYR